MSSPEMHIFDMDDLSDWCGTLCLDGGAECTIPCLHRWCLGGAKVFLLALPWILACQQETTSFSKSDCISWADAGAVRARGSERLKDLISKGIREWEAD